MEHFANFEEAFEYLKTMSEARASKSVDPGGKYRNTSDGADHSVHHLPAQPYTAAVSEQQS